jgi:hypothetical protein
MATMPGQNEQPKPASQGGVNEQRDPKHSRPTETTKQTMPGSPVQPGQEYETKEPKRREPEKPADAKRAPEHEPGYEAKHQKEAKQQTHQDDANRRSQADDSKAKIDADHDEDALHTQKANRTRPARAKQHVKHAHPAKKAKKPVRKHK